MTELRRLKNALESQHEEGPFDYPFKFVMPLGSYEGFTKLLPQVEMTSRMSKSSKYISVSFDLRVQSADEVVALYERVRATPGLLSL